MKEPEVPYRNLFLSVVLVPCLIFIACTAGCATREARHRTLNILFDGVPPLDEQAPPDVPPPSDDKESSPVVARDSAFHLHGPYAARRCSACHEATFSNRLTAPKETICLKCHEPREFALPYLHGPAAAGQCGACHHPHRSRLPYLLLADGESLCTTCHSPETFSGLENHKSEMSERCLGCHGPHGGQDRYLRR